MARYRTTEEIYHYDRFKLLVLLLLLAGLLGLILFSDQLGLEPNVTGLPGAGEDTVEVTPTIEVIVGVPGEEAATPEPTAAVIATDVAAAPEPTAVMVATPLLIAPQPGTDLTAGEVIFAGTGEPGLTVRAVVDGAPAGETGIDAGGNWALPIILAPGSPQVILETLDAGGAVVAQSGPYVFNVIGGEVLPGENGDIVPGVDGNSGTNPYTGLFTIDGTAPAGSTVEVFVDGVPAGQTVADAQGQWTLDVVADGGPMSIQVRVVDPAGNETSTDPIEVEDPTAAPGLDLPCLVLPDPDTGDMGLTMPSGGYTWTGTGLPGTTVNIIINGQNLGSAPVNDQGNWALDLDLPSGSYTVQLVTIDPTTGEQLGSTQTVPFTVVNLVRPTVNVPDAGWTSGSNEISGTAAPGVMLTVFVNGNAVADATAGPDGVWTATVELPTGQSVVDVRLVGEDGRVVFGSDPISVLAVGPEPTIIDVLTQAGQFNTLLTLAQAAGLDGTLASSGTYTLFAPPDPAFSALPAGVLETWLANPQFPLYPVAAPCCVRRGYGRSGGSGRIIDHGRQRSTDDQH
ncbi:MAG: Ig-like domain-containing protein [Chloroflexota bacterium]